MQVKKLLYLWGHSHKKKEPILCLNITLLSEREELLKPDFHHLMPTSQSLSADPEKGPSNSAEL